jgi:MFS transporter, CP family, cyanate transporter
MKTWHYALIVFLGGCCFGVLSTVVKLAYAAGYSMTEVTGSQFILGTLLLWMVVLFTRKKKIELPLFFKILLSGLPMGLTGVFYYKALQTLDASLAIIFLFQFVWIGTLMEWILYRKKPTMGKIISIMILLFGSVLAAGILGDGVRALSFEGAVWGFLAAITFSTFILVSGIVGKNVPPILKSALLSTGGSVIVLLLFPPWFLFDVPTLMGVGQYGLFLGLFGVALPPLLFSIGMPHVGPGLGTILSASELPVAVFMSALILAENISIWQWIGVILIIGGIIMGNVKQSNVQLTSSSSRTTTILLLLGIVLVAANLRPALTSVGPLIGDIRADMSLSNVQAGLITTIPLIGFAGLSILAPRLGRRFGNEVMLFAGLIALTIGTLLRFIPSIVMLYMGTALLGLAIAVCNVLLPGLIKHKFPGKVGLMTGVYSTSMGVFAAIAAGISVPLTKSLNWNGSLAVWAILGVIAVVIWIPQILRNGDPKVQATKVKVGGMWRSPLAWQVTSFMGFTSLAFYITVAWLPEILIDQGLSVATAGWMLSLAQLAALPASFLIPLLADRYPDQRVFVGMISILYIIGLVGLFNSSIGWVSLWVVCIGLAQGASFSLALTFLGLRASNPEHVGELSGMAQSLGYSLAAIGPMLFGYLRDSTHSWTVPLMILFAAVLFQFFTGLLAGRDLYVIPDGERQKEMYPAKKVL